MAEPTVEQWRAVVDFAGYEVSNHGRLRSYWRRQGNRYGSKMHPTPVMVATRKDRGGYVKAKIGRGQTRRDVFVHRLVLEAFVGPCPEGMETLHDDNDRTNNKLGNLKWGTRQENVNDMVRHGTKPLGDRTHSAKLSNAQAMEVRRLRRGGMAGVDIAKRFGVHKQTVYQIALGRTWKHLPNATGD